MQVYPSGNYIPTVILSPIIQACLSRWLPFLQHTLRWCCNYLGILSSIVEILLFDSSLLLLLSSSIYKTISLFQSPKIASSYCNSSTSTPVPPLGTSFNTISCFSDHLAYLPNVPQCSRWIHQRGHSSPRSLSSTIHPGWTVLPVPSPSIVPTDNNPN